MYHNLKITVMKKKDFLWSMLAFVMVSVLSVGLLSCGGGDDEPDTVTVSMPSVNFGESGGSQSIQVLSNTKWTVSGNPGWLTVAPTQGSGNGAFSITANTNTESGSRNCTLFINAGSASTVVSVNQQGPTAPAPSTTITISNNSSRSYMPLYIFFSNSRGEQIHSEDLGDLHPGGVKSASIPGSTASWFLAFSNGSTIYYTADHEISETSFTITNATVWYYN